VQKAYGNEALNGSKVFRWYSLYGYGRELEEDDERGDCLKSNRDQVNIAAVANLVKNWRRIAPRMKVESLSIPKAVVICIMKQDLRRRKFFSVAR
jgi:hypothetical protein